MNKNHFKNVLRLTVMLLLYSLLAPSFIWAFNPVNLATGPNVIKLGRQTIDIPRKWGAIQSVRIDDPSRPLVVLIEDLHCHAEVQQHIAGLLDHLRQQGLALVGLEGTSRTVTVDKLRTFPLQAIKAQVGRYLVRQGRLSGAELAASLSAQPLQLQGMENQDSYDRSYHLAMSFLTNETLGYVWDVREQLNNLKAKVYHEPLLVFDKGREAFKAGRWPLRKYGVYLLQQCGVHHIDTTGLSGLKAYLRPLPDASLNQDDVQPDLAKAEQLIRERLYNSPDERRLDQQVHTLDEMEKLLSISMSPEEWANWDAAGRGIEGISAYLGDQGALNGSLLEAVQVLKERCQAARDFYRLACQRSRQLALNMIRAMQAGHQPLAALITGGFHTAQIQQALKARAVNVVTIRPRLTRVDLVNPYWDILKGKCTPLERLLAQNQKALAVKPGLLLPELRDEMDVLLKALLAFEFKGLLKKNIIQFKARIQSVLRTYPANNQAIQFDPAHVRTLRARLLSLPFTLKAKSFFVTVGEQTKALKAREVMSIDGRHTVSYYDRKPEIAPEQARLLFMAVRWATYAMVSHQSVLTQRALTHMTGLFGLGFNLNLVERRKKSIPHLLAWLKASINSFLTNSKTNLNASLNKAWDFIKWLPSNEPKAVTMRRTLFIWGGVALIVVLLTVWIMFNINRDGFSFLIRSGYELKTHPWWAMLPMGLGMAGSANLSSRELSLPKTRETPETWLSQGDRHNPFLLDHLIPLWNSQDHPGSKNEFMALINLYKSIPEPLRIAAEEGLNTAATYPFASFKERCHRLLEACQIISPEVLAAYLKKSTQGASGSLYVMETNGTVIPMISVAKKLGERLAGNHQRQFIEKIVLPTCGLVDGSRADLEAAFREYQHWPAHDQQAWEQALAADRIPAFKVAGRFLYKDNIPNQMRFYLAKHQSGQQPGQYPEQTAVLKIITALPAAPYVQATLFAYWQQMKKVWRPAYATLLRLPAVSHYFRDVQTSGMAYGDLSLVLVMDYILRYDIEQPNAVHRLLTKARENKKLKNYIQRRLLLPGFALHAPKILATDHVESPTA